MDVAEGRHRRGAPWRPVAVPHAAPAVERDDDVPVASLRSVGGRYVPGHCRRPSVHVPIPRPRTPCVSGSDAYSVALDRRRNAHSVQRRSRWDDRLGGALRRSTTRDDRSEKDLSQAALRAVRTRAPVEDAAVATTGARIERSPNLPSPDRRRPDCIPRAGGRSGGPAKVLLRPGLERDDDLAGRGGLRGRRGADMRAALEEGLRRENLVKEMTEEGARRLVEPPLSDLLQRLTDHVEPFLTSCAAFLAGTPGRPDGSDRQ